MRKLKQAFLLILLLSLALAPAGLAMAATPGSAADPLVTRSWVDQYVDQRFAPLQAQLDALRARLQAENREPVDISLYIGRNTALVNGASRYIDPERPAVTPQLKTDAAAGGYTMVPIRFVAEAMGIEVEWLPSSRQVRFSDGNRSILLTVGSLSAAIDGAAEEMDYAPYIENQRTYVHIRFVAEAFDCRVGWEQSEKRVDISR